MFRRGNKLAQDVYADLISLECLNSSQTIDSADLLGKVVVLVSWRNTELISLAYLDKLKEWASHYSQNLVVIGLFGPKFESEKKISYVESLINLYEIEFPVYLDDKNVFRKIYGLKREPGLVVFDQLGRRRSIGYGNVDLKSVHDMAISLMNQGISAKLNRTTNSILLDQALKEESFFNHPSGVAFLEKQNLVLISDTGHHRLVLAKTDGRVESIIGSGLSGDEDGDLRSCSFSYPKNLCVVGDLIFVADSGNHKVKCIDLANSTVRTVVGTGLLNFHQNVNHKGSRLSLAHPTGLASYKENGRDCLLISNSGSRQVLSFDLEKEEVVSFIGNGRDKFVDDIYKMASFMQPTSINTELPGFIFILDSDQSSLRLAHNEHLKTLIGNSEGEFGSVDGGKNQARMEYPVDLAWDGKDSMFITDASSSCLRKYTIKDNNLVEVGLQDKELSYPYGITRVSAGHLLLTDFSNHSVYSYFVDEDRYEKLNFTFTESQGETKQKIGKLPELKSSVVELTEYRQDLASVELNIELELPASYTLNIDSPNFLMAYEEYNSHWYLIRKMKVNASNLNFQIKLRNVGRTEHYVVDLRLHLCRVGVDYEAKENNFRLHIEKSKRGGAKPVAWKLKAQAN